MSSCETENPKPMSEDVENGQQKLQMHPAKDQQVGTRCKATSKQTGKQCGQFVAAGFEVCKWHGGGAPQVPAAAKHRTELVKAKAQGRLEAMIDGAITRIDELSKQETHLPTAFNAAKHILDRGLGW